MVRIDSRCGPDLGRHYVAVWDGSQTGSVLDWTPLTFIGQIISNGQKQF